MLCTLAVALLLTPVERGEVKVVPGPEEFAVPERFRLESSMFPFELRTVRTSPGYSVSTLTFPSPVETLDRENNTVHAEYFQVNGSDNRPAVVVLHILGADFALSRFLAARLADQGVNALFVKLPYYGERRPPGIDARFLSSDIERSVLAMRQGICDVRRAAYWLGTRAEVDPDRIGVTGISLGGIVSAISAGVDPNIRRTAILLGGGGLADILWEMPEREARNSRQAWIDSGRSRQELEALTLPFDPLTYAEGLREKRVLMISGRVDEIIPPEAAVSLWNAAGKPEIHWLDCGHYSAAGYLLPAFREVIAFFKEDEDGAVGARELETSN